MSGYHRPHRTHGVADLSEVLLARRSRLQNRRTHESVKGFRLQVLPVLCSPDAHEAAPVVSPDGLEPSSERTSAERERKGAREERGREGEESGWAGGVLGWVREL